MPSSTPRRRTRDELESDGDDGSSSITSSSATDTPQKRPRLDPHINAEASRSLHGGSADGATINGTNPSDFSPGAIVRVSVENFVTYEKAEFFPGPNLNMVIGPNGTGKSSLVCAICLGLGYGPKHLGRAGSIKEFVKHGKDTATIELELRKRPSDRTNFVIRVLIRRDQNTQKWWLNGKETTHKAIQSLMRQLKIQVDNLCQFLPQDRVVEFAQCTPVDLLHETLRAAAPAEMLEWQQELTGLYKDKKQISATVDGDTDTLSNLENRQQGLQADVDRIREREEIQANIKTLEYAHLVTQYEEARKRFHEMKDKKADARRTLRRLQDDSGPSLEAVNDKQDYATQVTNMIPAKLAAVKDAEKESQKLAAEVNTASEQVKEFQNKIEAERTGFEAKKKEMATLKSKITSLQADLRNEPPDFNAAEWNQKIRAEEHTKRELESDRRRLNANIQDLRAKGNANNAETTKVMQDIGEFDTQQGQRLAFMKKNFPDLAKGWEWIQEHQDEFEMQVFGPPMVSCSIKDERYSDQVQSILQNDDFTCFITQTRNDFRKLSNQLYKVMSLSVVLRMCGKPLNSFTPPISHEEARSMGLDGFAIDYLDGPEPVLAMLCSEKGLHRSGVSLGELTDAQYEALVHSDKVSQWATRKQSFIVRRRKEYGPQAMTTVTKNILPGRYWTSQQVDTHEKDELNRRITELKEERAILRDEHNELKEKRSDIDRKMEELDEKIDRLRQDKSALQKDFQKWQSLPEKIESEQRKRADCETDMRQIRKTLIDLQYEWDEATLSRSRKTLEHAESLARIADAHNAYLEARIWQIEAESDIESLKRRNSSIMERMDEATRLLDEATKDSDESREQGRKLGEKVNGLMAEQSEEGKARITSMCEGRSSSDILLEIDAEKAKLELIHAANPNVIREFERRAAEIDRLKRKMNGSQDKLLKLEREIKDLMDRWEPRVDALVSSINDAFAYNFEQINCAGEIRVHKDDDFDQWALDIMVKFRENEELQQLNAHRQSGGERAVSTIFYLMALQSMAQSPFRVVDEINQGMDPRNERMVHERMVEIACREHTSQYFLITPKLLTGLRYDPKMRILCIASGEHMPREGKKLDFKRCLRIQKNLMAAA